MTFKILQLQKSFQFSAPFRSTEAANVQKSEKKNTTTMEINSLTLVLLLTIAVIIEPKHILCPRPACPDLVEAVVTRGWVSTD